MTRRAFIERVRRQIYNGQPPDDATITIGLVNNLLGDAIGVAAKTNYTDALKLDGIAYVNGGFYTTYKNLSVSVDEQFLYKITLPHIPVGIGQNEGVSTLQFKDSSSRQISHSIIWLTEGQKAFYRNMRPIPNKISAYQEGEFIYVISTIILTVYTAQVCMISGGLDTDLDSTLNVPPDYFTIMMQYLQQQFLLERSQPVDATNDGLDAIKTT